MRNLLLDELPKEFKGAPFNSGFKTVLEFFRVFESDLTQDEKAVKIGRLFFNDAVPDSQETWDFLTDFILAGDKKEGNDGERLFDFDFDSGRIVAAFYQAYQIDLTKVDLHWWVFLELFKSLPEETILKKIMEIRGRKPGKNDTPEQRLELAELQEAYALPIKKTEEKRDSVFAALHAKRRK